MNQIYILISFLILTLNSCQQKITADDIAKLNGYWEIEKVISENTDDKEYTINEFYDYFEIKNKIGFRKKVKPQLDGTFIVNNTKEKIAIETKKDVFYIAYKTEFSNWSEEIIKLNDDELVLKNDENTFYHYKKAGPIKL
jgi:hypothetical protein